MNSIYVLRSINNPKLEFELHPPGGIVGRGLDCTIKFDHQHLSRKHARFVYKDSEVYLEDLESANGTFVNNKAVEGSVSVKHGDVIKFAFESFSFLEQQDLNATIMMGKLPLAEKENVESSIDVGVMGGNNTIIRSSFPLPAQWGRYSDDTHFAGQKYTLESVKKAASEQIADKEISAALMVTVGSYEKKLYGLKPAWREIKIGRDKSCQLLLPDASISNHHSTLKYANGGWSIIDNNSSNGMYINKSRKEKHFLNDGDVIRLGSVEFLYCRLN